MITKVGSSLSFIVSNNTPDYANNNLADSLPNGLSITAYYIKGKPVKLLDRNEKSNTSLAIMNLNPGQYVLLALQLGYHKVIKLELDSFHIL
jgi:hypothetical protein